MYSHMLFLFLGVIVFFLNNFYFLGVVVFLKIIFWIKLCYMSINKTNPIYWSFCPDPDDKLRDHLTLESGGNYMYHQI